MSSAQPQKPSAAAAAVPTDISHAESYESPSKSVPLAKP
jgi:hypothetical protein